MKFEVERRALIDDKELPKIISYLEKNGKQKIGHKRFSICYVKNKDITADPDNPIDLRVKITNGQGELSLKYGDWHSAASREEYGLSLDAGNVEAALKMLNRLGFKWGILAYTERKEFVLSDLVVSIDDHYDYSQTFIEIEVLCESENEIPVAESRILDLFEDLGLEVLDSQGMQDFFNDVNKREKWKFDFTKEDISDFVKTWHEFILCER